MPITWYICCIQYIYVIKNICLMTVTCYVCCAIYLCHDNLLLNDCSMICIFWCFSLCQNIKFKPAYTYMKMSLKQHGHFATNGFVFPLLSEMLQNTVKKNIYILTEPRCSSKSTHTDIKSTPVYSRQAVSCPVLPRPCHLDCFFFTQFMWHEMNVQDNWQLVVLPQSESTDFDPHWIHDNLSVPLWFICVSLCQIIKIKWTNV